MSVETILSAYRLKHFSKGKQNVIILLQSHPSFRLKKERKKIKSENKK